jgi:hypothetical protein
VDIGAGERQTDSDSVFAEFVYQKVKSSPVFLEFAAAVVVIQAH